MVRRCLGRPRAVDVWIGCTQGATLSASPTWSATFPAWDRAAAAARRRRTRASQLLPPPGALTRAVQDDCWAPHPPDADADADAQRTRTRTVAVLIFADRGASDEERYHAQRWMGARPAGHLTEALRDLASAL